MERTHFKISFCSDQFAAEIHYVEFIGPMVVGHVTLRRNVGHEWTAVDGRVGLVPAAVAALATAASRPVLSPGGLPAGPVSVDVPIPAPVEQEW